MLSLVKPCASLSCLLGFLVASAISRASVAETQKTERIQIEKFLQDKGFRQTAENTNAVRFEKDKICLRFEHNSRTLRWNGVAVFLNAPAMNFSPWAIMESDLQSVVLPLMDPLPVVNPLDPIPRILIDPGHGGSQDGALSATGLREKELVLDIGLRLDRELKAAGLHAQLSRSKDALLSLSARTRAAQEAHASLFISLHCNHAPNCQAEGIETYTLPLPGFTSTSGGVAARQAEPGDPFTATSGLLACHIHNRLLQRTGAADRGVRRAQFEVLRNAPCPAVLIECGFLSNTNEAGRLALPAYRQALAEAVTQGILEYLGAPASTTPNAGSPNPQPTSTP